jgi:hypothetical protein
MLPGRPIAWPPGDLVLTGDLVLIWPLLWIACGLVAAGIAWTHGGNRRTWSTLGVLLGPIGLILALRAFRGRGPAGVDTGPGVDEGCPAVDDDGRTCVLAGNHDGRHRALASPTTD